MTNEQVLAGLDPRVAHCAEVHIKLCKIEGIRFDLTQGARSFAAQLAIWNKGRTAPGEPCTHDGIRRSVGSCFEHPLGATVTNAKPGYSWHNWNRAYDGKITTFEGDTTPDDVYDGPWSRVVELGERSGMLAGGRWKHPDLPHFENHLGDTLGELIQAYPSGFAT